MLWGEYIGRLGISLLDNWPLQKCYTTHGEETFGSYSLRPRPVNLPSVGRPFLLLASTNRSGHQS